MRPLYYLRKFKESLDYYKIKQTNRPLDHITNIEIAQKKSKNIQKCNVKFVKIRKYAKICKFNET